MGLSFFVQFWCPRESVLWGSSVLSEFCTSLSKVLTLWHCVKVKQRYLFSLDWKFFSWKNFTLQFLTGKQLSNSKVHKEYETIFQQLLLWAQMVSNFLAVVVRRILYYCFRSREGCCLESTLFENDPMSYMTWVLKNTHTALSYF